MKKPPAPIVSIDSRRSAPEPPEGPPASPSALAQNRPNLTADAAARASRSRRFSDPMTRAAFLHAFFSGAFAWSFWKACAVTRCAPTAASEELFEIGRAEYQRRFPERAPRRSQPSPPVSPATAPERKAA